MNERGLEHGARPEDGWGKPVGQSSAPRPRSPGGQSPARLLRGSTPSENTGLTARRPKGHYDKHKTSETVSTKVSMKVRWGSDGEEKRGHWKRAVSPEYGSQGQDHEDLQVRKVSIKGQRHEGGLPRLVSPSNDAAHPRRGGQPEVPEPRRARRRMYGGGNPIRKYKCTTWSIFIWVMLLWVATATTMPLTPSRRGPKCFLAVPQRRGWWNIKATNYNTQRTIETISRTTNFIRNKEHNSIYKPITSGETPTVTTRTNKPTHGARINAAVRPVFQSPHATRNHARLPRTNCTRTMFFT